MEASVNGHDWLKHWLLVARIQPLASPYPGGRNPLMAVTSLSQTPSLGHPGPLQKSPHQQNWMWLRGSMSNWTSLSPLLF